MKRLGLLLLICTTLFSAPKIVAYSYNFSPTQDSIDFSKITHLIGAFVKSDSLGNLTFDPWISEENMITLLHTAKAQGITPMVALGTSLSSWAMTKSESSRSNFIKNILAWCDSNKIEGIDLDLEGMAEEYNWGNPGTFFPGPYESLATELRAAMPDSMILTAAVGQNSRNGAQWTDKFVAQLNWVNVMVYDDYLTWEGSPVKNHSPYEDFVSAGIYWGDTRALGRDRVALGVPFYARGWDLDNNRIYMENPGWEVADWGYRFFINRWNPPIDADSFEINSSDSIQYPRKEGITGRARIYYNGPQTIQKKCQWVKDSGFAGIMIWEISQDISTSDDRSLLKSIYNTLLETSSISNIPNYNTIKISRENNILKVHHIKTNGKLEIFTMNGRLIKSYNISPTNNSIQLPTNNNSLYIVKIIENNAILFMSKI